jgi:hypothetical protein
MSIGPENPGPGQYGNPAPPPQSGPPYSGSVYGGGSVYGSGQGGVPGQGGGPVYGGAPAQGGAPVYGGAPGQGGPVYGGGPGGPGQGGGPGYGGPGYGGDPGYGGGPGYGGAPVGGPPPPKTTNGLSIAGLVLAFLIAPVGFVLSLVGFFQAGKRGQKGKGLAVTGIIVSLLLMVTSGLLVAVAVSTVSKLTDAGCTTGKAAILDNASRSSNVNDPAAMKAGLQATIDGLNSAAAKAQHADVRSAMKALADDYAKMLEGVKTGNLDPALSGKIDTDVTKVDSLCTIGAK